MGFFDFFGSKKKTVTPVGDYGSFTNPIVVPGIPYSYAYLEHLAYPGASKIEYVRHGSTRSDQGVPIDIWELTVFFNLTDGRQEAKKFTVYINCYGRTFNKIAPPGFFLK